MLNEAWPPQQQPWDQPVQHLHPFTGSTITYATSEPARQGAYLRRPHDRP